MEKAFLEFVADIMDVDVTGISMDTAYDDLEVWDSMMMLTLVMEIEQEYSISIPIEKMNEIHTLRDLYQFTKCEVK